MPCIYLFCGGEKTHQDVLRKIPRKATVLAYSHISARCRHQPNRLLYFIPRLHVFNTTTTHTHSRMFSSTPLHSPVESAFWTSVVTPELPIGMNISCWFIVLNTPSENRRLVIFLFQVFPNNMYASAMGFLWTWHIEGNTSIWQHLVRLGDDHVPDFLLSVQVH